jgi:hypothetical protein
VVGPLPPISPGFFVEGIEFDVVVLIDPPRPGSPVSMTFVVVSESFPQVKIHELPFMLG